MAPSPKFQLREAMVPSLSVDESVKLAVSALVVKLKFAVGVPPVLPPPETQFAAAKALTLEMSRLPKPVV